MSWTQCIVFFGVSWWFLFLLALPFGVRPVENPAQGHNTGAPERANIKQKAIIATCFAILLSGLAKWGLDSDFLLGIFPA